MKENSILEIYKKISFSGALSEFDDTEYPIWLKKIAEKIWFYSDITSLDQFSDAQITEIIKQGLTDFKEEIENSLDIESKEE